MTWSGLLSDDKDACKCVCVCLCLCVFHDFQLVRPQTGSPTCSLPTCWCVLTLTFDFTEWKHIHKQRHQLPCVTYWWCMLRSASFYIPSHTCSCTCTCTTTQRLCLDWATIPIQRYRSLFCFPEHDEGVIISNQRENIREREWRRKRRGLVCRVRSFPCDHQW